MSDVPEMSHSKAPLDRRSFLQMMSATLAVAGITPDTPAPRDIVPSVIGNPETAPGTESLYASAVTLGGYAEGVLVRHQAGRPMKIEGNPEHPASRGGTDAFAQAAIYDLYDPRRAAAITYRGRIRARTDFVAAITASTEALGGKGVRLLTGATTSPSLQRQIATLGRRIGDFRWHRWESVGNDNARRGTEIAYGRPLDVVPHIDKADIILAVESDLFDFAPGRLAHVRDFARRRRGEAGSISRLYAIESTPSLTGAAADHRAALAPRDIEPVLRMIASALSAGPESPTGPLAGWATTVAQDLAAHRGAALLHLGPSLPPPLHALAAATNEKLGAPIELIEPVAYGPTDGAQSLTELAADMAAGKVGVLAIWGGDPVYSAPADLGFAEALSRVPLTVYLGSERDATARACLWHVPETHVLESWGDARAYDGTATIQQPQIRRLFDSYSAIELVALLSGTLDPDGGALVRAFWQDTRSGDFDAFWPDALRRGIVPGSAAPPVTAAVTGDLLTRLRPQASPAPGMTALFRPDSSAFDGRFLANPWLQELPRPLTRLTWDNAALLAPATAARLGIGDEDVVEIGSGGRQLRAPALLMPGQAEDCVTLPLGYGRALSDAPGFDAGSLRKRDTLWTVEGIAIKPTGVRHPLALAQHHQTMEGVDLLRRVDVEDIKPGGESSQATPPSLYADHAYPGRAWAMAIDLSSCIGCGACVTACQAENNIPVVGKEEVARGHIMQWLRIDRYQFGGEAAFQPVPCMHCENAPCEVVCPVNATVHDSEGLNAMVYNRCVGTRFCSNNCPYKVRRFNFLAYADSEARPAEARNADVTVRARGVMEKCTYCIQRIRKAEIVADRDDRALRDGEVVTACQAACPAQAIVFGDRNDGTSLVRQRKARPGDYVLLDELNTRPRTSYTPRVLNRNRALSES